MDKDALRFLEVCFYSYPHFAQERNSARVDLLSHDLRITTDDRIRKDSMAGDAADPAKALEYKEKGNKCFQAGKYSEAETLYTKA